MSAGSRSALLAQVIARNTIYNILTQVLSAVLAFWAIPHIVRGLTQEGFGLLSIVWVFVGYFALLDFGISRANTKYLAEAIARGDREEIHGLAWVSLTVTVGIGVVSGLALFVASPWLVNTVLEIAQPYRSICIHAFQYAAISIPFLLAAGTMRGFQMAFQRFDLVNIFQGALNLTQWLGAMLLLRFGFGLGAVIFFTLSARILLTLIAFLIMPRLMPDFFSCIRLWDGVLLKKIFAFGGWVTVSQVIGPLLLYIDRFFIGRLVSLDAVTLYSVPQEILTRVLIIPLSLTATLFPAMSEHLLLAPAESKAGVMVLRSLKYLLAIMMPTLLIVMVNTDTILSIWMGKDFAAKTTTVFRILSVGLLFNALAQIPVAVLHARGRPRLVAIFHIAELPLMVGLNLLLIPLLGIVGAAISWSVRMVVDAGLLLIGTEMNVREYFKPGGIAAALRNFSAQIMAVGLCIAILLLLHLPAATLLSITAGILILYGAILWRYGFDDADRRFFLHRFKLFGAVS